MKEKIIFFGSSDYCIPILEIINKTFRLSAIVTKKGHAVEKYALSHNIKIFIPEDKNGLSSIKNDLKLISPDLAVVADYGLIIPPEIFTIPLHKTLNIHFSKLPALRGPSPVQYTILMGEKTAWISIIVMDKEMDTGDILWQKEIPLVSDKSTNYPINQLSNQPIKETTGSLYQKLFNIVAADLPDVISKCVKNELKPQKQNHTLATYTRHLTRDDGFIPANLISAALEGKSKVEIKSDAFPKNSVLFPSLKNCNIVSLCIERAYRTLTPWPGLWTQVSISLTTNISDSMNKWEKKRLKILQVHLEPLASQGETLRGYKLILDLVQLEGKKPVSWKQFSEGYPHFSF